MTLVLTCMVAIIVFLGILLVIEQTRNRKERAELISRIMAKSLTDFSKNTIRIPADQLDDQTVADLIAEHEAKDRVPIG